MEEIFNKKNQWNELSSSLEYLKLKDDEKENVWSSFEYEIEDEDNYYENRLHSATMIKNTLELFSEYGEDEVCFYIYCDDDYSLQKTPSWLEEKIRY